MKIFLTLACMLMGYVLGSIPFALVIGKVFYKTDVREHGSGNLGGTNTGRVLGKKAGVAVIALDLLKVVLAVGIASLVGPACAILTGLCCCLGHAYPIFAHFKGGKAVASMFGFLLSISIFVFHNAFYFLQPAIMFLAVLYLFKMVSVASICSALSSSLMITSMNWAFSADNVLMIIGSWLLTLFVIVRHKANIARVIAGTESKIKWM